jgi:hypothetical protein
MAQDQNNAEDFNAHKGSYHSFLSWLKFGATVSVIVMIFVILMIT